MTGDGYAQLLISVKLVACLVVAQGWRMAVLIGGAVMLVVGVPLSWFSVSSSTARSPALATATTYYWRVRANAPVLSPWSAKWSFTTSLGATVIAPELLSPKAGASGAPLKPVFQWGAIAGADSYELLVSSDASFANPIIVKIGDYALPATAWQSNISLDYNTTYFWKVRASGSKSYSSWSAVGAFTTELAPSQPSSVLVPELLSPPISQSSPAPTPALPPQSLPQQSSQPSLPLAPLPSPPSSVQPPQPAPVQLTFPGWFMYLGGALLLAVVILLITVLVLVVVIKRS